MNRMNVDERRAKLIEAAIEVMLRDGVSRTTTRSIVQQAGMTTGAFHYCFFSKEELELEVIRVLNARAFDALLAQVSTDVNGPEIIDRVAAAYVDSLVLEAPQRQLTFELTLHALRQPNLRDAAVKHYRVKFDGAEEFLDAMANAGGFRWRLPTSDLARLALGLAEGIAFQWVVTDEHPTPARLHDALVAFLRSQVAESS